MTTEWPVKYIGDSRLPFADSEEQEFFEKMAIDYLWVWTGYSLGTVKKTVRPSRCSDPLAWDLGSGRSWGGRTYRWACSLCGLHCTCDGRYAMRLPSPISSLVLIQIGTETLDVEDFTHSAMYVYGEDPWPTWQDFSKPLGQPGTWGITYMRGIPVPYGGQVAAGLLAKEMYKAAVGDSNCALPERVQSITRQGVSMEILDGFEDLDEGRTGIWLIDSWVMSMTRPKVSAKVYGPDTPRHP